MVIIGRGPIGCQLFKRALVLCQLLMVMLLDVGLAPKLGLGQLDDVVGGLQIRQHINYMLLNFVDVLLSEHLVALGLDGDRYREIIGLLPIVVVVAAALLLLLLLVLIDNLLDGVNAV